MIHFWSKSQLVSGAWYAALDVVWCDTAECAKNKSASKVNEKNIGAADAGYDGFMAFFD
jgi:hypothetical protein